MLKLESRLNRLWAHEKASYGLRVFIALGAVMGLCWYHGALEALPTLFLGIIASALAETDDNWWGRTKSVALSLVCFALGSSAVLVLFPHPWAFVAALTAATFALTLLGALGERYASIAQATIAVSIYCMIGLDASGDRATGLLAWRGVGLLMAGAAWYGLLSILWAALFANRPVRERLARLLYEVGQFLRLKAALFEPVREADHQRQRLALAQQNAKVVDALNAAKTAILSRFGRSGRPGVQSGMYFRLYYMAQDFHERASSSHYPYDALTEAFFHSDVLYRCQRLLALQGQACRLLGEALRLRQPFAYGDATRQAMTDLDQSLAFLRGHSTPEQLRLLGSLDLLGDNLQNIERQLSEAARSDSTLEGIDTRLRDSNPHTLGEMGRRVRQQLTPKSLLFRHGLRMAIALAASYGVMKLLNAHSGYWILLTTAFVCRPNYGATRLRLVQRIAGTLIGLGFTWAFMQLFPAQELQLLFALLGALVFFITRTDRYVMATAAITVMALLCFNLIGDGFLLLWPRLIDTVVGCVIAAAASFLILPDWQTNRVHLIIASIIDACTRYLDEVMDHYLGKDSDDLRYRIARRDMHNADAALSASLSGMLRDPRYKRGNVDAGFRFLALSNTLLSYLSALGAHRAVLPEHQDDALLEQAQSRIHGALTAIHQALATRGHIAEAGQDASDDALGRTLEQMPDGIDGKLRLVRTQLALITYMLPQLRAATNALALPESPPPSRHGSPDGATAPAPA